MVNAIFVQEGKSINYTPAAAVAAGVIVPLGELIGITKSPIAASAVGSLCIEGVFRVIKDGTSGPAFAVGEMVHWDSVNSLAVRGGAAGSGIYPLGTCTEAASDSVAEVECQLLPYNMPAAFQGKTWEDVTLAGGSKTLDVEDSGKVINITVGSATNVVTLPAVAAGLGLCVRLGTSGGRIAISPNASDAILGPDLTGVADTDRILAAATSLAGDYISLNGGHADGFMINAQRGIWVQA